MHFELFAEKHEEEVCTLWNREAGVEFPLSLRLLRQNGTTCSALLREGSLVAIDETTRQLAGVVIAKYAGSGLGFISVLLVAEPFRGRGIGRMLVSRAENALLAQGANKLAVGGDPGHFMPGIPAQFESMKTWFTRRGYRQTGTTHDLLGDFRGRDTTPPAALPGLQFTLAENADREPLLAFLHEQFPGRWEQSTAAYFASGGTGREFVLACKDGRIIGFCRINDAHSPVIAGSQFWTDGLTEPGAGIGPLGIAADQRGHGYGLAIVQAGLHFLRQRGIHMVIVDWTTEVPFYRKLGFEIWKTYDLYESKPPL